MEIDGPAMRKLVTRLSEEKIQKKAISLKVFCCICAFIPVVMFAFVIFYYWGTKFELWHFLYSTRANISIMSKILTTRLFQN